MKRQIFLVLFVAMLVAGLVSFVHPITSAAKDTGLGLDGQEGFSSRSAGSWFTTGDMLINRRDHTATLLPSGKVLVVGGYNGFYLLSAELYDPISGVWALTDEMTIPRSSHTATLLADGTVLVVGGLLNSDPFTLTNSAEIYNPLTGTWTVANFMVTARYNHTATLLNDGKVLVAGGYNVVDGYLNSAELFNPVTGLWTSAGTMSVKRYMHTATLLEDGRVLVAGGKSDPTHAVAEIFDPVSVSWSTTGPMITGRYIHTATLVPDGKVLVSGGFNADTVLFLESVEIYDPDLGTWDGASPMSDARAGHQMIFLPNATVLAVGGLKAGPSYLNSAELYDPIDTEDWTSIGSMNAARTYHTATLLSSGQVLVAGGYNNVGFTLKSAELYSINAVSGTISCFGLYHNSPHTVFVDLHTSTVAPPDQSLHIHCGDSYLFYDIPDGTYYVGAWLDLDGSGGGPPGPDEPHAWYEVSPGEPEPINISGNVAVPNIDIQLGEGSVLYFPLIRR